MKHQVTASKRRLTKEYQETADDFEASYAEVGCYCHQNPPCGYCTHEGHPENLAETPEAWVEMLEPMCKGQESILLGDDTPALKYGGLYLVENNQVNRDKILRQYELDSYIFTEGLMNVLWVDIERIFGGIA